MKSFRIAAIVGIVLLLAGGWMLAWQFGKPDPMGMRGLWFVLSVYLAVGATALWAVVEVIALVKRIL